MVVNYKAITEFFEEVVLYEGRTDVQAHVGFMNINNSTIEELATRAFGGHVLMRPFSDIDEYEKIIYVYAGDEYEDFAYKHFPFSDGKHFVIKDAGDQTVLCWVVGASAE